VEKLLINKYAKNKKTIARTMRIKFEKKNNLTNDPRKKN
jgi:hypothetical protein